MDRIGFVGLGHMGRGMAANLLAKGFPLTVVGHRSRAAVEALVARGAREAGTLAALAAAADVVFLCLNGSHQVEPAVAGLEPGLAAGSVVVDASTSDPVSTDRLAARLAARGVGFVDAPLGGTPKEAEAGTLTAIVGGEAETLARVRPAIEAWASRIVVVGGVGDGHRMKLINNFLSLGYGALYAEALALAAKVGLPAARLDGVIRGGRMDCGFYRTFMAYALEGDRESHRFTLTNAYKDLKYLESMANDADAPAPLAGAVKNLYAAAVAAGWAGPEDYLPHLADFVARAAGARRG